MVRVDTVLSNSPKLGHFGEPENPASLCKSPNERTKSNTQTQYKTTTTLSFLINTPSNNFLNTLLYSILSIEQDSVSRFLQFDRNLGNLVN